MAARLVETILIQPPGTGKPSYSNVAYSALGRLLLLSKSKDGPSWEEWTAANIFKPLGMSNSSTFGPTAAAIATGQAATGYDGAGNVYPSYDLGWNGPCGGITSTVNDLGRFGQAIATSKLLPQWLSDEFWGAGCVVCCAATNRPEYMLFRACMHEWTLMPILPSCAFSTGM